MRRWRSQCVKFYVTKSNPVAFLQISRFLNHIFPQFLKPIPILNHLLCCHRRSLRLELILNIWKRIWLSSFWNGYEEMEWNVKISSHSYMARIKSSYSWKSHVVREIPSFLREFVYHVGLLCSSWCECLPFREISYPFLGLHKNKIRRFMHS